MTVLLLGGTGEARALASLLVQRGVPVLSSLAGAVREPRLPDGQVRIGGFGGVDGLVDTLREEEIGCVVDATHPFAARISTNAARAAHAAGVPLLRLVRPGWDEHPDAARWTWVDDLAAAGRAAAGGGGTVLLTTGRHGLAQLRDELDEVPVIARVVDAPEEPVPAGWQVLRSRGPHTLESERDLLRDNGIRVLVSKDSGGAMTAAKLAAAAELGVEVVMVRRPAEPAGVDRVAEVSEAVAWVVRHDG